VHDVIVRRAMREDNDAIALLAGDLGYPATSEEMLPRLDELLVSATEAIFVAAAEQSVIAWIQVGITITIESGASAEIRGLVVSESRRSGGVGAMLVAAAEEWGRSRGVSRMRVRSNVIRERTHRFYERLGYVVRKSQKAFEKKLG
jgi:GNAT superfamily N-acetyltransferase